MIENYTTKVIDKEITKMATIEAIDKAIQKVSVAVNTPENPSRFNDWLIENGTQFTKIVWDCRESGIDKAVNKIIGIINNEK